MRERCLLRVALLSDQWINDPRYDNDLRPLKLALDGRWHKFHYVYVIMESRGRKLVMKEVLCAPRHLLKFPLWKYPLHAVIVLRLRGGMDDVGIHSNRDIL